MKAYIHNFFLAGCLLYGPAIVAALAGWKRLRNLAFLCVATCLFLSAALRIYYHWPLMCLFQEPYLISLFAVLIALYYFLTGDERSGVITGGIAALVAVFAFLFPGDIYASFVKTNSLFASLFSLASSLARAAYLCSGALALGWLWVRLRFPPTLQEQYRRPIGPLIVLGFASQSLGMFCGALWAYVGWGTPIQWESPLLLGMAGVWFWYSFFLHLHLDGGMKHQSVPYVASLGGILAFVFTFLPDTGTFHLQGFMR